jgi:hypothetical protein
MTKSTFESTKPCVRRRSRPVKHTLLVPQAAVLIPEELRERDVTCIKKSVRFATETSVWPAQAVSQPETWYQATDYSNFLQDRRLALASLLQALMNEQSVHASDYVGIEQQLCQQQFITRKLQCLQYVQLVVCQQYMKDDVQEIQAAAKCFTTDSGITAYMRAVSALGEQP